MKKAIFWKKFDLEKGKAWLAWKPFETVSKIVAKSLEKYTFGFRTGSKLQKALDGDSEITLKDAAVSSVADTAKSTGNIYISKTAFSLAKVTFLESAIGTAILSSSGFIWLKTILVFVSTTLSQTFLGVLYASFSATLSLSFSTIVTMCLTYITGSQVGKAISSTKVGAAMFELVRVIVPMIASVLPLVVLSSVLGYLVQQYKKSKLQEKNDTESTP